MDPDFVLIRTGDSRSHTHNDPDHIHLSGYWKWRR